jgi:soluble lytic murein transglycosylase-like protein
MAYSRRFPVLVLAAASTVLLGASGASADAPISRSEHDGIISFSNMNKSGTLATRATKSDSSDGVFTVSSARYDDDIHQAAALYQIPEELVRAVIRVESGFDPRAVSHTNACGLMQLMPGTAERMLVTDIFDPRQNIFGGVRYLRVLANMFNGDLELTLAGYNAGENAVIQYGGIPPYEETRMYVVRVIQYYRYYRELPKPG